jgi:glutathione S-transferase
MSELTLYSARACPYAHRTRLVLAEKRLRFETVEIDLRNKPGWFQNVSGYGKVPAIEHNGQRIWESAVINEYLDEVFRDPPLLPSDAHQRARARIWIDYANTRFVPAFAALLRAPSESASKEAEAGLRNVLSYLETEGFGKAELPGPFFFGEELSLVDFTFFPWFERWEALQHYRGFALPSELRKLHAYWGALRSLDTVKEQASPTSFYIERYAQYAGGRAPAQAQAEALAARASSLP